MPTPVEFPQRECWARVRFAIIGPLLAAPPPDGDLQAALATLAAMTWLHPVTGLDVRFGVSTITYPHKTDFQNWLTQRLLLATKTLKNVGAFAIATIRPRARQRTYPN